MSFLDHKPHSKPRAAKQAPGKEMDINNIVKLAGRMGAIPHAHQRPPMYLDLTGLGTFHSALTLVTRANQVFNSLPSKVREACGNKVEGYVSLLTDKKRRDQAISLGLIPPDKSPQKGDKKAEEKPSPDDKKEVK